jgi:hypothetical protein
MGNYWYVFVFPSDCSSSDSNSILNLVTFIDRHPISFWWLFYDDQSGELGASGDFIERLAAEQAARGMLAPSHIRS